FTTFRRHAVHRSSTGRALLGLASLALALFALALPGNLRAQSGTTSLRGTVTDKTGATVSGANVSLTNAAQAIQRQTQTSNTGAYEFNALPPGSYVLSIEMTGFRRYERKNLQLLVDSPSPADVTPDIGATAEKGGGCA